MEFVKRILGDFVHFPLPSVSRHLPNDALAPELAVEFRIDTFTTVIDVQALTAFLTEPGFMFVADANCLPVRVISAFHRFFSPPLFLSRLETGRGLSKT